MARRKAKKRKSAPKRRSRETIRPEELVLEPSAEGEPSKAPPIDLLHTEGLTIPVEEGALHFEGDAPGEEEPAYYAEASADREEEDDAAIWQEREERHAKNTMRLTAIVAVVMVAILGIWLFSVSSMVKSLAVAGSDARNLKTDFQTRLGDYQQRLQELTAEVIPAEATEATTTAEAPALEDNEFLKQLKTRAAEAAVNTTSTQ